MGGTRRSLRRAQAWRLEPPGAATAFAGDAARRRWDEARAKAIAWAVAMANDPRVVYLDTETTGFGPRAEIVDIAVVGAAGDVLYESLVRPTQRIPWDATAVHGITDADVAGAPDWEDLYEDLVPVLEGRRIIVYNVVFDKQMVSQACSQYALAPPAADWDCAMKRYAGFYGSWDAQKRWYRFQKLEHAVLAFGAEPGGHRAAADAFACRAVVLGMAATTPPALDAATETPDPQQAWQIPAAPARTAAGPQSDDLMRWACAARDFLALLDDVPIDLHERPGACGIWSAREVAAHCAGWEWEGARRLRLLAADPAMTAAVYDVDGFNRASVAVRARQDWTATLDDLARGSAALAKAAVAVADTPRAGEWLCGRAADFEEHAEGLRRWLRDAVPAASRGRAGTPW